VQFSKKIFACLTLFFMGISHLSASETMDEIAIKLSKTLPEMTIDSITDTPLSGIYQINAGPNIIYVSEDARYVISGDIIDLKNDRENITETSRKTARVKSMQQVVGENAISFAPKNPKHRVTVFTDIDCGYCRKFHEQVTQLNQMGIAVDYLAFPRGGPGSDGFNKMVNVWCSADKNNAMTQAKAGKNLNESICTNHHVEEQFKFGLMLGINGTPTIILEDGTMIPGYVDAQKLSKILGNT
jgi:thiol:disulfide interchange protein DsbC